MNPILPGDLKDKSKPSVVKSHTDGTKPRQAKLFDDSRGSESILSRTERKRSAQSLPQTKKVRSGQAKLCSDGSNPK